MKLIEIEKKLKITALLPSNEKILDTDVTAVYTGDLLSDIMGNAPDDCIFVTIQAHKNTIAVATLKDCPAIIICNNRLIPDDMKEAAKNENIQLYLTSKNQFEISGELYKLLKSKNIDA
jgi:hypothetical protein